MGGGARRGTNKTMSFSESPIFAVNDIITLEDLDVVRPHCFAGVQFFSDSNGLVPVTPSAGLIEIYVQTVNSTPVFELVPNHIEALTPTTISWAANTKGVRATPSGIEGASYYKLVVTCNET